MGKHKPQTIHRTKLFRGAMTAQEVHRALGFRSLCASCGGPPVIRIKVFTPLIELRAKNPTYCAMIEATNPNQPGTIPTIDTSYGPMVKISDVTACQHHRKEAEVAAAHPPRGLSVLVEIDRGPGADRPLVAVA